MAKRLCKTVKYMLYRGVIKIHKLIWMVLICSFIFLILSCLQNFHKPRTCCTYFQWW